MKIKIILVFAILLATAITVAAYLGFSSLEKSKRSIAQASAETLIEQMTMRSKDISKSNNSELNSLFFAVQNNLKTLQQITQSYYEKPLAFNLPTNKQSLLTLSSPTQSTYMQSDGGSTVIIPKDVHVTQEILDKIRVSALLNLNFANISSLNKDTAAYYFSAKEGFSRYYPSKYVANFTSSDDDVRQRSSFISSLPQNSTDRGISWTKVYQDKMGLGAVVTASIPIYANDNFMGMLATDVTIENFLRSFMHKDTHDNSFLLNERLETLVVNEKLKFEVLSGEKNVEVQVDFKPSAEMLNKIKNLPDHNGYKSLVINGQIVHLALTQLERIGWIHITVLSKDNLLSLPDHLHKKIEKISKDLIFSSVALYTVLLLVFVLIASLLVNRFIEPILRLTQVAKSITLNGHAACVSESEINIDAKDELKTLVDSFKLMRDFTEFKQTQLFDSNRLLQDEAQSTSEELQNHKFLLSEIYKSSSDGLVIFKEGRFVDANESFLRMFKVDTVASLKEMPPGCLAPLCQPDGNHSSEMFKKSLAQCVQHGHSHHERLVVDTQGKEFWVEAVMVKVVSDDDSVIYTIIRALSD